MRTGPSTFATIMQRFGFYTTKWNENKTTAHKNTHTHTNKKCIESTEKPTHSVILHLNTKLVNTILVDHPKIFVPCSFYTIYSKVLLFAVRAVFGSTFSVQMNYVSVRNNKLDKEPNNTRSGEKNNSERKSKIKATTSEENAKYTFKKNKKRIWNDHTTVRTNAFQSSRMRKISWSVNLLWYDA